MSLVLVPEDTENEIFLATARLGGNAVHIGNGVYIGHKHFPDPEVGTQNGTLAWNLDQEIPTGQVSIYEIALPENPGDWDPYLLYGIVNNHFDMSLGIGSPIEAAAAKMLIYADPNEMSGNIVVAGYPADSSLRVDGEMRMYFSEGVLQSGAYSEWSPDVQDALTGGAILINGSGVTVAPGMSGSPLFLEDDPDGDGVADDYLIGTVTTLSSATALAAQYHRIASFLEDMGQDADDFPRHVLMSGQTAGSVYTTVTGTFFNEDIYGGVNADTLIGGGGDDHLTGGAGIDRLVFALGDGNDVVYDFTIGEDILDFSGVEAPSFETIQQGSDVLLRYGAQGDSVLFANSDVAEIEVALSGGGAIDGRGSGSVPLYGTAGEDVILAEGGTGANGYLLGAGLNPGADTYINLGGASFLFYGLSGVGLTFDLPGRSILGGDAEGDTWVGDWAGLLASEHGDVFRAGPGMSFQIIDGAGGDDVFNISAGGGAFAGGAGADTFRLMTGDGAMVRILDFELGTDVVDLSLWGVTGFDAPGLEIGEFFDDDSPLGDYVVLTFGDAELRIEGVQRDDLIQNGEQSFIFADDDTDQGSGTNASVDGTSGDDRIDRSFVDQDGDVITDEGQTILAGDGNDLVKAGKGDDLIEGGDGNDRLQGKRGNDTITDIAGNNRLNGNAGDDVLEAGDGDDRLEGGRGNDTLTGGDGYDVFRFRSGHGLDEITDYSFQDRIFIDRVRIGGPDDFPTGVSGIEGADGYELHYGFGDVITLLGVTEAQFRDWAYINRTGTSGDDLLTGGLNSDVLRGMGGQDTLDGGVGRDTLYGNAGNDSLRGGGGDDKMFGGSGKDVLSDSDGQNWFYGGAGQDILTGAGGTGDDMMTGGRGNDTMTGGGGRDTFVFAPRDGVDIVVDFAVGQDVIALHDTGLGYEDLDIADGPDGTFITYGFRDSILLVDVVASDLSAGDFMFL